MVFNVLKIVFMIYWYLFRISVDRRKGPKICSLKRRVGKKRKRIKRDKDRIIGKFKSHGKGCRSGGGSYN